MFASSMFFTDEASIQPTYTLSEFIYKSTFMLVFDTTDLQCYALHILECL